MRFKILVTVICLLIFIVTSSFPEEFQGRKKNINTGSTDLGLTKNNTYSSITVDLANEIKEVNYGVLGSALSANPTSWSARHSRRQNIHHIDGLGVWDPVDYNVVKEIVDYAVDIGISYFRFPGGFADYRWEHAVGPIGKRPAIYWNGQIDNNRNKILNHPVTFGIPEFLKFCSEVGAKAVIGISEYPSKVSIRSATDLVEYLNGPCDESCTLSIDEMNYDDICVNSSVYARKEHNNIESSDWAQVRVCDKYALGMSNIGDPWNAEWFEYGNESYSDFLDEPETYIKNYLVYQEAMKKVDPTINLGAVIAGNYQLWDHHRRWNMLVIPGISSQADFFIVHKYIPRFKGCCDISDIKCQQSNPGFVICTPAEDLFAIGLAGTNGQLHNEYKELNDLIFEITKSHIPIAVTEYNGSYNELNFNYFESLGNALVNAEHIKQLMLADNIAFATHHHFNNSNTGVIKGRSAPYKFRPSYYVFQFYNSHFGTKLLDTEVISDNYEYTESDPFYNKYYSVEPAFGEHRYEQILDDVLSGKEWDINADSAGVTSSLDNNGVLIIHFDNTADVDYHNAGKETKLRPATWYKLSAFISTENLSGTNGEGVYISVRSGNSDNLVVNPGFELGVDKKERAYGWVYSNPKYVVLDSSVKRSGSNSFRFNFPGNNPNLAYYQPISVEPNTDYIIEGYVKANLSTKGRGVRIDIKDARSWECGYAGTPEVHKTKGLWEHVYQEFTTKSSNKIARNGADCSEHDTDKVSLMLVRQKGSAIKGAAWWDDIKLSTVNTSKKKRSMLEGTNSWRYIDLDFRSKSNPDNPDGTVHAKVYITRDSGGSNIGGTIKVKDLKLRELVPGNPGSVPYLSVNASKNDDGSKVYLMVVNKHMHNDITAPITVKSFIPQQAEAWTLNADSVDATVETDILNGGFEDITDYKYWKLNDPPGVKTTIDKSMSFSGHKSAKIVFKGTHDVQYNQTHTRHSITVKPGVAYRLEGYIKTEKLTSNSGLMLIARDGHGEKYGEWIASPVLTGTNEWTYVSTDFTTGPETRHISIRLKRAAAGRFRGNISGTAWVDHIVLKELNVKITQSTIVEVTNGFKFTFPAHSLTTIEISGKPEIKEDGI